MIGAALFGWVGAWLVPRQPAADPKRVFQRNPLRDSWRDIKLLCAERKLFRIACASSYFWFLAGMSQMNVYLFATTQLHVGAGLAGPLLGLLAFGGGLGAVLAGFASRGKVRLGLTPLSVFGIVVSLILLYFLPERFGPHTNYIVSCVLLFFLGLAAGFYDVPLQSYLQTKSRIEVRGTILAATTSLAFLAMLISAGAFWLMQHVFHLTGGGIFLTLGCISLPVALLLLWYFSDGGNVDS
jgi:acyl-[acyl-carrier-protein]-phospholipid O-acyltransferase/long-chain-fatty-acid--[acyl-carrier-protein] ligase